MNEQVRKFMDELSKQAEQHEGRYWWTAAYDIEHGVVQIVMRDRMSDVRLSKLIPFGCISESGLDPVEQAGTVIESMENNLKEATMMSTEEAIDQLEDLAGDIWAGARDGRPIYVDDNDFRALQVAIEALKEKME